MCPPIQNNVGQVDKVEEIGLKTFLHLISMADLCGERIGRHTNSPMCAAVQNKMGVGANKTASQIHEIQNIIVAEIRS